MSNADSQNKSAGVAAPSTYHYTTSGLRLGRFILEIGIIFRKDRMAFKRRVPRKKINRPVGILFRGEYVVGRVTQVGEGGVMLSSFSALKEDDRVLVTFSLKGERFITSKATVRYVVEGENMQYGLEFDELPFQARREIRSFVASHSEKPKSL